MWLSELKVALVEKNVKKLKFLMDDLPQFTNKEDIDSALYLIEEGKSLVQGFKDETEASMVQMQKNLKFLNSAVADKVSKFDIMS